MTSGKSGDIVKQEIEAELREYVQKQHVSDPFYVRNTVSQDVAVNFQQDGSLNELIADALLQIDKQVGKDPALLN